MNKIRFLSAGSSFLFLLISAAFLPSVSLAQPDKTDHFVYCFATDGHYVLFTDPMLVAAGSASALTSQEWRLYVGHAKPSLDLLNGSSVDPGHCIDSSAPDYLTAKSERDYAVSEIMLKNRAVRSFWVNFRP